MNTILEETLREKLRSYLVENTPDVLIGLQGDFSVTKYLEDKIALVRPLLQQWIEEGKPQYIIEELCLNELTKDLRPSRYLYIRNLLEEEFLQTYKRFRELGVLTYETINLIEACKDVFDKFGFNEENEDDRNLYYAITGTIAEYLERN